MYTKHKLCPFNHLNLTPNVFFVSLFFTRKLIQTQVDSKAKPAFPRQTSVWWFDCKSAQNTPLLGGLSAELRAPVFVSNESMGDNTPPTAASYSSHMLQVDKEGDVEIVNDSAMRGHHVNPEERYLTHESESLTQSNSSSSNFKPVSALLSLTTLTILLAFGL